MTKPAKPPTTPPAPERPQINARERSLAQAFHRSLTPGANWSDALAQLLADYRGELKAERLALDKCTRGNR